MMKALERIPLWISQPLLLLLCWLGWLHASRLDSWAVGVLSLLMISISLIALHTQLRLLLLRTLVSALFLIFSLDKLGDLEAFAESIFEYQIISQSTAELLAAPLAYTELITAITFFLWTLLALSGRLHLLGSARPIITLILHGFLIGMLTTFCGAIIYGLFTNPYMDCGCGDSWNPIDVFSKSAWYILTDIKLPGLPASLFRNLISLSILAYSYIFELKNLKSKSA